MTMLFWLFAVYGWVLAIIFGWAYILCYRRLKRSWAREEYYMQMIADQLPELQPSLAAFKAARIVAP